MTNKAIIKEDEYKENKPKIRWWILILSVLTLIVGLIAITPNPIKYAMQDEFERMNAPTLIWSPSQFTEMHQSVLIKEYKDRGYNLHCYGNLRPHEHITPYDDYQCWANIDNAYGIDARLLTFSFSKGKLSNIRVEFYNSEHKRMLHYLHDTLGKPNSDGISKDNFGALLLQWRTEHGIVVTALESPSAAPNTIFLWVPNSIVERGREDKLDFITKGKII